MIQSKEGEFLDGGCRWRDVPEWNAVVHAPEAIEQIRNDSRMFRTSGVVLSTVREAADKDYELTVLSGLCADFDPEVYTVLIN